MAALLLCPVFRGCTLLTQASCQCRDKLKCPRNRAEEMVGLVPPVRFASVPVAGAGRPANVTAGRGHVAVAVLSAGPLAGGLSTDDHRGGGGPSGPSAGQGTPR